MSEDRLKNMENMMLGKQTKKPCKACNSFQSWRKKMTGTDQEKNNNSDYNKKEPNKTNATDATHPITADNTPHPISPTNCPLDKDELGRSTWNFLHTMAAYYPEEPTNQEAKQMNQFIKLFAKFYPCDFCAIHLRESLKTDIPDTSSNKALSVWFCKVHNEVNARLNKPLFDCSKVLERWKDGWKDGSCD